MIKKNDYRAWVGAVALVGTLGCASEPPAPPPIDLDAARQELMDADRAWVDTRNDAAAFSANFTADAVFLPPNAPRVDGRGDIEEFVTNLLGLPGFSIIWEVTSAHVSDGADLGYTLGTYEMTLDDPDGNPMRMVGKYLTAWRKQADGEWRVTADMFNEDAPPPAAPEP